MDEDKKILLVWKAPQYEHRKKTSDWYWVLGILTLAGITLSLLAKNFLLAFLIAISVVFIIFYADKESPITTITITKKGIGMNNLLYPYSSIQSFWVYKTTTGLYRLLLHVDRGYLPYFTVPIASEVSLENLRTLLREHIEEKEHPEPTLDQIMHHIGF